MGKMTYLLPTRRGDSGLPRALPGVGSDNTGWPAFTGASSVSHQTVARSVPVAPATTRTLGTEQSFELGFKALPSGSTIISYSSAVLPP
jgi:hypothetical protein